MNKKYDTQSRIEAFWEKVIKIEKGCWRWMGATNSNGNGVFGNGIKPIMAHRFSWEIHHGEIPEAMFICRKCSDPGCVNPAHLFLSKTKSVKKVYK